MRIGPAQTRPRACRSGSSISSRWSSASSSSAPSPRVRPASGCRHGGTIARICRPARCSNGCVETRRVRQRDRLDVPPPRHRAGASGLAGAVPRHRGVWRQREGVPRRPSGVRPAMVGKPRTSCRGCAASPRRLRPPQPWRCCCRGRLLPARHRPHRRLCLRWHAMPCCLLPGCLIGGRLTTGRCTGTGPPTGPPAVFKTRLFCLMNGAGPRPAPPS